MENQFHSLNVKDDEAEFEETNIDDLDIQNYFDRSMLGFIPLLHRLCYIMFYIITIYAILIPPTYYTRITYNNTLVVKKIQIE